MAESEIWAENVERINGKAVRADMTNGNTIIAFGKRNGKIIEISRYASPGVRVSSQDDLWLPLPQYSQARRMATAILNEKR